MDDNVDDQQGLTYGIESTEIEIEISSRPGKLEIISNKPKTTFFNNKNHFFFQKISLFSSFYLYFCPTPPNRIIIFLSIQNFLTSFGSLIGIPLMMNSYLCMSNSVTGKLLISKMLCVNFFVGGICTTVGKKTKTSEILCRLR